MAPVDDGTVSMDDDHPALRARRRRCLGLLLVLFAASLVCMGGIPFPEKDDEKSESSSSSSKAAPEEAKKKDVSSTTTTMTTTTTEEPPPQTMMMGEIPVDALKKFLVELCAEEFRDAVAKTLEETHGACTRRHLRSLRRLPGFFVHLRESQRAQVERLEGVRAVREVRPTSLAARAPWHLDRINQNFLPLDGDESSLGSGAGASIFVLDTGLDATHAEFDDASEREVRNVASFVDGETFEWWPEKHWHQKPKDARLLENNDRHGHGTMTSSVAAGKSLGVAKAASLYHVKVLDDRGWGDDEWTLLALDKIAEAVPTMKGPTAISLSFGDACATGEWEYCRYESPLALAIRSLVRDLGVAVAISAGNDNDDACFYAPQASADALSVGASDSDDMVAPWSNVGACVDLIAPGVDVDVALSATAHAFSSSSSGAAYAVASGTSFAAPAVAGALAVYARLLDHSSEDSFVTTVEAARVLLSVATRGAVQQTEMRSEANCPNEDRLLRVPASFELGFLRQRMQPVLERNFTYDFLDAPVLQKLCPAPPDRRHWPPPPKTQLRLPWLETEVKIPSGVGYLLLHLQKTDDTSTNHRALVPVALVSVLGLAALVARRRSRSSSSDPPARKRPRFVCTTRDDGDEDDEESCLTSSKTRLVTPRSSRPSSPCSSSSSATLLNNCCGGHDDDEKKQPFSGSSRTTGTYYATLGVTDEAAS